MKPLLLIAASLLPLSVFATIDIQPHVLEIQQPNAVVNVINHGTNTQYIRVELSQLNNPGESPEQESLTPVGEQPHPMLFAVPAKLTLGPNQSARIIIKALQAPDKEQVYRLSVAPENTLKITGGEGVVVGVQVSYMGLVRHLPVSPQPQWAHHCIDGKLALENTGNIRLQWHQLKNQLEEIDDFNLYPGQFRQLPISNIQGMIEDKLFSLQCSAE
ncbi:hypothetical protein [Yersinia enterocolitica]|uniref:hypothetical protein n=1 Tax=Yersinia enterocolitica TaxID=630 RepID=UPI000D998743|nr:hypothetical protein [Yersinia enterocolitica]SQA33597.1 alpha-related fimbriae chaperone 2 [Yersinia enterocolitica]SUP65310.1 alpha-related fimbriae chaperone 2 [Yersinia enterocolitica]HDM8274679.1 hypothetical protein [Yersinia enterocolitica]HED5567556.1 hypothetical protein [Yersinia enterocolitica]